jgi:hypothetical protein
MNMNVFDLVIQFYSLILRQGTGQDEESHANGSGKCQAYQSVKIEGEKSL